MSPGRLVALLLALLLLAPPVALLGPTAPLGAVLIGAAGGEEPLPKWGFYVYMAGDNSLSEEAADDLLEMQAAGSNGDREVVALVDQSSDHDSRAYRVLRNGLEETSLADISSGWGDELDMGDPATLRDFLKWATTEYPAQERILVIWDHGNGFKRVAEDGGSYLTVPEIEGALAEYRSETGHGPLTLIGFDACLMGMFEIAYELREHAAYIHGSEAYEPQEGWTYNHLLPLLGAETTREQMLEAVVHSYVESYRNGSVPGGYSVTATIIDTAQLEPLHEAISGFGTELRAIQTLYRDEVDEARANSQVFENSAYRDLHDLTLLAAEWVPSPAVRLAGESVRQAQANATVVEEHWTKPGRRDVSNAHGLTIYYPASTPSSKYFDLAAATGGWRDFIDALASELPQPHASLTAEVVTDGANITLSGSYSDDAARLELFLQDTDGNILAHEEHMLGGGALPTVMLQPDRSGSYRLDVLLYDNDGWLQDHYIAEGLVVDLQLPDLVVEIAGPVIGFPNGQWLIAGTLSEGHTFSLGGTISNQGTVTATDIQLVVTDGEEAWQFQWPELTPGNSTEWLTPWELSNLAAGNYTVSAIATTNTASDEDPASNMDSYMLQIVPPGSHSYQITSNHVNITQFEDGDFSPTVVNITLDGDTGQGVAFVELLLDYPVAWSLQDTSSYLTGADGNVFRYGIFSVEGAYTPLFVPAGTASLLASFLPSLSSVAGPHEVGISLIDHNNLSAGSSSFTVNVPQYHGLRLSAAEQDNGDWTLFVENSGNGQETVILTKVLPEGLTLHLSESYIQLAPFETREVRLSGIAGVEGSYSVSFSAQSQLQPEVQVNLTFELSVGGEVNSSWIPALLLGLAGGGVVAWAVARRQLL
ncbi:MAG: clostripain-related cysteine peptidase [Candidatus Thermoplasmatota archaeon]|nr:clostripain-related cysteine peptidase [Candidatus Thermoplasmatota archaeon]